MNMLNIGDLNTNLIATTIHRHLKLQMKYNLPKLKYSGSDWWFDLLQRLIILRHDIIHNRHKLLKVINTTFWDRNKTEKLIRKFESNKIQNSD